MVVESYPEGAAEDQSRMRQGAMTEFRQARPNAVSALSQSMLQRKDNQLLDLINRNRYLQYRHIEETKKSFF